MDTLDIQKCNKKWANLKHNHICSLSFYLFSKFSVFESYNKSFPSASFKTTFFIQQDRMHHKQGSVANIKWGHHNWVAFMVPLIYFIARGCLSAQSKKRCLGLMGLLVFQGGLGWYMVKSGLGLVVHRHSRISCKISNHETFIEFNQTRDKSRSLRSSTRIAL